MSLALNTTLAVPPFDEAVERTRAALADQVSESSPRSMSRPP